MNSRVERRDGFACSTVLQVPRGAPLSFAWANPVRVSVGSGHHAVLKPVVVASPSGWTNPVVQPSATRDALERTPTPAPAANSLPSSAVPAADQALRAPGALVSPGQATEVVPRAPPRAP